MTMTMRVPGPVAELIERGVVDLHDVEASFERQASQVPVYSTLSPQQHELLLAGSGLSATKQAAVRRQWEHPETAAIDWQTQQIRAELTLLNESATIREIATMLGSAETTVSRWHKAGQVVGFVDTKSRIRLPRWQFTAQGVVPGWKKIAPHAQGLSLSVLSAVMRTPSDELGEISPLQFLIDGGDPDLVRQLLDGLRQW